MPDFFASYNNKIDAKGRVSVPAAFRTELGDEKTIYCIASLADPAIDIYTRAHIKELTNDFKAKHGVNSMEFRRFQSVMSGDLFPVTIDGDGRIILPEDLRAFARIGEQAVFVGAGAYFQIWEPETRRAYREEARNLTRRVLYDLPPGRGERRGD